MSPSYTIIGTPFSTFTRSITLGLQYKGIAYKQVRVTPHSDTAYENHPFGFLPTLVIHNVDGRSDVKLRESQAIARYIDRVAPEPSLHISPGDGGAVIEEQMWEFVSFAGAHGFPAVEKGVVKPRVAGNDAGKLSDAQIREEIKPGVEKLQKFLAEMEAVMAPDGFVYGEKLSWADFFLYPLLADLRAIPEGELLSSRLRGWMDKMGELEAVKATSEGTLSVGARPP
ncbi:hypothetical protein BV22DRAFT_593531 [Leucogyrophana mollusca]|uniref:Uncharacterized protein n=1 Tax=Leucogyrophana mollusca TaxID=85980 RepID=A0ACB8BD94_9AGAM|nr:hypothetical protein BV22DRAFT_593531 [Leucogyrophana mollusca]